MTHFLIHCQLTSLLASMWISIPGWCDGVASSFARNVSGEEKKKNWGDRLCGIVDNLPALRALYMGLKVILLVGLKLGVTIVNLLLTNYLPELIFFYDTHEGGFLIYAWKVLNQ